MLSEIPKPLGNLVTAEGIKMVALYLIDGTPVCVKMAEKDKELLPVLYWLEGQIKNMLHSISTLNLDEASFKFKNLIVVLIPVSKTAVLGIIADEESSIYKRNLDIKTVCLKLGKMIKGV
jgi:predicted regulator of Ras-like GTPase activity (Roadblock/LC7/MglB family)